MSDVVWDERFESALRENATLLDPDEPIAPDLDLSSHGLDSLATVSLILDLEDAFGVAIPDELLTGTTFATPQDIWSVIAAVLDE